MSSNMMVGEYTQWSVLWLAVKGDKRKIVQIDHGFDLKSALEMYVKAVNAGKKFPTLRCNNVAFPPPEKYHERYVTKKTKVRRNGRVKVVREKVLWTPMKQMNEKGSWWCPYCREFRRFEKLDGFWHDDIWIPEAGYHCPMCGASHRLHAVRRWNPQAQLIEYKLNSRKRQSSGRRTTGRRRSRRG